MAAGINSPTNVFPGKSFLRFQRHLLNGIAKSMKSGPIHSWSVSWTSPELDPAHIEILEALHLSDDEKAMLDAFAWRVRRYRSFASDFDCRMKMSRSDAWREVRDSLLRRLQVVCRLRGIEPFDINNIADAKRRFESHAGKLLCHHLKATDLT